MAQERPNRSVEWLLLVRQQTPILRERFNGWLDEVRAEPRLLWEATAVRYATYAVTAIVMFFVLSGVAHSIAPPPPPDAGPEATTADFHVVCVNDECGHHFLIHRKFGFRGFPVTCPKCKGPTGLQARRCNSQVCRGRWVAPVELGKARQCPRCGAVFD